jgi:hypothetical protein
MSRLHRKGRKSCISFDAIRRREIERLAKHLGAADTEDFDRFLIAWYWHNPQSNYPIEALIEAARRTGGKLTKAQASAITKEASITPQYRTADGLGRFLGLKHDVRQKLRITTIRGTNVGKGALKELRKRKARVSQEARRRANGSRPRAEYEANSLSATKPWEKEGMSKTTWYRNKRRTRNGTSPCAAYLLTGEHTPVPPEGAQGWANEASPRRKKERGLASSQTATTLAADEYASLPLVLRLLALGLPLFDGLCARAA